jgi:hypothetical protein
VAALQIIQKEEARPLGSSGSGPLTSHSDDVRIASTPHRRIAASRHRLCKEEEAKRHPEIHNRVAKRARRFFFLPLLRSTAPYYPLLFMQSSCPSVYRLDEILAVSENAVHCRYPSSYECTRRGHQRKRLQRRQGSKGRQARTALGRLSAGEAPDHFFFFFFLCCT